MPRSSVRGMSAAEAWLDIAQLLARSGRALRRRLADFLGPYGVTDTELLLLFACSRGTGSSQHELGASAGVSAGQASGLLERLKQQGWLESRRVPGDRRVQTWTLSPSGGDRLRRILRDLEPLLDECGAAMGDEQRRVFTEILTAIADRFTSQSELLNGNRGGEAA